MAAMFKRTRGRVISPGTQAVLDEIERGRARSASARAEDNARMQVIADLLTGEARFFGTRVALAWPDGLPFGMTEQEVRGYIRSALERWRA